MEPATAPQADMAPELTLEEEQVSGPGWWACRSPGAPRPSPRRPSSPAAPLPLSPETGLLPAPGRPRPPRLQSSLPLASPSYTGFAAFCTGLCFLGQKSPSWGQGPCGDRLPSRGCPRFPDEPRGPRAAPWPPAGHILEGPGLPTP